MPISSNKWNRIYYVFFIFYQNLVFFPLLKKISSLFFTQIYFSLFWSEYLWDYLSFMVLTQLETHENLDNIKQINNWKYLKKTKYIEFFFLRITFSYLFIQNKLRIKTIGISTLQCQSDGWWRVYLGIVMQYYIYNWSGID